MSELKAYIAPTADGKGLAYYYLKSEADKVIDELEERIDELQKATDSAWSKVNTMYDELRHHKYKRCLAMTMWCKSKSEIYNEFAADASEYMPSYEARFRSKAVLYQTWAMRWLELTKKFKNKEAK